MSYLKQYSTRRTPQFEPLPGQVPNSAGGHAWELDDWGRLRRFLERAETFCRTQEIGYHPEMILAGRSINDNMGIYVAQQVAQLPLARVEADVVLSVRRLESDVLRHLARRDGAADHDTDVRGALRAQPLREQVVSDYRSGLVLLLGAALALALLLFEDRELS